MDDNMYQEYLKELAGFYDLPENAVIFGNKGFAVIDKNPEEGKCHPLAQMNITDFYILPRYRRKGYGLSFAQELINGYDKVSLMVLRKNAAAFAFWNRVFEGWDRAEVTGVLDARAAESTRAFLYERRKG